MINQLRLELRRLFPGVKVDEEALAEALRLEVIKRELVEGDEAAAAGALLKRLTRSLAREKERIGRSASGIKDGADEPLAAATTAAVAHADAGAAPDKPS